MLRNNTGEKHFQGGEDTSRKKYKKGETEMIICNLAVSLLLLSLSVSGTTNGSEQNCYPQIKVPRNTVFKARVMTEVKINCTASVHGCHRSQRVSWCKMYRDNHCNALNHSDYIKTEWKNITEYEGTAFLIFLNISMEDAGSYRCREELSVSHSIIVNVTLDNIEDDVSHSQSNTSDLNTLQNDDQQWLWPYVYICGGIAGLVIIVVTFIYVVRCQGRKLARKDMANTKQSSKTQKSGLLLPPHLDLNSDLLTSVIYTRV